MWWATAYPPPTIQKPLPLISLRVSPWPWWTVFSRQWLITSSATCPFLGRMTGWRSWSGRSARRIWPPTLNTLSLSMNGSNRYNELVLFNALLRLLAVWRSASLPLRFMDNDVSISCKNVSLWTCLTITVSERFKSCTFTGSYSGTGTGFFSFPASSGRFLNMSWRRRQTATARLALCQIEKYSKRFSRENFSSVPVARVETRLTSGSSDERGAGSLTGCWESHCFHRKSGPFHHLAFSHNSCAPRPREASSAGLLLDSTSSTGWAMSVHGFVAPGWQRKHEINGHHSICIQAPLRCQSKKLLKYLHAQVPSLEIH